jgi:TRAP-type C4-dicarboxylate transport system substrate-binding protein
MLGLAVILSVMLFSSSAFAAKGKIVWTFNQMALGKWCDNDLFGRWLPQRMAEATGGRLELHVPLNLTPVPEVLHAVRDGVIQGAVAGTPYYSGEWPLGSFHAIPGVLRADDEYPAVMNNVVWKYWDKSLKSKFNIRLMGINHWCGVDVFCSKPIKTVADFKGKKLRGMGYYDSLAFQGVGAAGMSIPWDEAFMSVQRGVVEGLVTGLVVYESMGFWEYCKYINKWPVHGSSCAAMIIVNGKAFDALPADLKPIVQKVLKEAGQKNSECNISKVAASLKRLKAKGVQVIVPSKAEYDKCLNKISFVKDKWIEQCKQAGSPEAAKMLDDINNYLVKYRKEKNK